MLELTIPAMTCNHCVATLTKAIKEVDKNANLEFDLEKHHLTVETDLESAVIKDAIEQTGYEVESVEHTVSVPAAQCCGSCRV